MDRQYRFSKFTPSLRKHDYGRNVKLIDDPYLHTLVAKISDLRTKAPQLIELLRETYKYMLGPVLNNEIPAKEVPVKTKMYENEKKAVCRTKKFPNNTKFTIANLLRAGMVPSLTLYEQLFLLFEHERIKLDNIFISRVTGKSGKIKGANISGAKTGESVEGVYLLLPDPMGATASSIIKTLNLYKMMKGKPKKTIIMGLIITPEYLKNLRRHFPDAIIYAVRLDRGLSPSFVLNDIPGKYWNKEKGLNKEGFIIPGAGGLGEIINNTTF